MIHAADPRLYPSPDLSAWLAASLPWLAFSGGLVVLLGVFALLVARHRRHQDAVIARLRAALHGPTAHREPRSSGAGEPTVARGTGESRTAD